MPKSIFGYIFKHSLQWQIYLFAGTLLYLPVLYLSFELPKIIVNDALDADPASFPRVLFGYEFSQVTYLILLCFVLLGLVLLTGGIRFVLSFFKGVLGEVMLRRLRYDLYQLILRFPLAHLKKVQSGEIVTMVTSEVEPLGRYMGLAVANPVLQAGTLLTALVFLFAQDVLLGFAAIVLFPIQAYFVPKLQQRMNALSRRRLANVRLFAGHVGETMSGKREIHSNDTTAFELTRASFRLGVLFRIRRALYAIGNAIIFLNTFFTQLTPFLFYLIGGYLVVQGELSLGALVAVIAAYREAAAPWNELLENYQSLEDNRVKYAALVENFLPGGLRELPDPERANGLGPLPKLDGALALSGVSLKEGDETLFEDVSFSVEMPASIALLGATGSGKSSLAEVLAGLRQPSAGMLQIAGRDMVAIPEDELGRVVAYVDGDSHVFTGTWTDNFTYGLKHTPAYQQVFAHMGEADRAAWIKEARAAGNVTHDPASDWVDYEAAGCGNMAELERRIIDLARLVGLERDLFDAGLSRTFDPAKRPELAERMLEARRRFKEKLAASGAESALLAFDRDGFNPNSTLAENLLFGWWVGDELSPESMGKDSYVLDLLTRHDLLQPLLEIGHATAETMIELFRDLPPGDERLQRFSLIDPERMPAYESLMRRVPSLEEAALTPEDRRLLLALAFWVAPSHQRIEFSDPDVKQRFIAARHDLMAGLPDRYRPCIAFYDENAVNPGITVRLNIYFGRIDAFSPPQRAKVEAILQEVIDDFGMRDEVMALGLGSEVGTGGGRLTRTQRQRIAIARCLLKRPSLLVVNEALSSLEPDAQDHIRGRILESYPSTTLVWVDRDRDDLGNFDAIVRIADGRILDGGAGAQALEKEEGGDALSRDIQLLAGVDMLSGLPKQTLRLIAFTGEQVIFEPNEIIFHEGDAADDAYIILEGEVCVSIGGADCDTEVGRLSPGTTLGEVALLSDCTRTATGKALGRVRAIRLSRDLFFDLIRNNSELALAVMRLLSTRLAGTLGRLSEIERRENPKDAI